MKPIYEPAGRAREYAALALNLYQGCPHGCTYCYAPGCLHVKADRFHAAAVPREGLLLALDKQCAGMEGDPREILLCFTCDPYPAGSNCNLTRRALMVLENHRMTATVLTKAGLRATIDFDILKRNDWRFGTSLCWTDDNLRRKYEPDAASVLDRIRAIKEAKRQGIRTWMSVEPVLDPDQALQAIAVTKDCVDEYRVGKLNGRTAEMRALEKSIDWKEFLEDVEGLLGGHRYVIKDDLEQWRGGGQ